MVKNVWYSNGLPIDSLPIHIIKPFENQTKTVSEKISSPKKAGNLKRAKVHSFLKGKLGLVQTQKYTHSLSKSA